MSEEQNNEPEVDEAAEAEEAEGTEEEAEDTEEESGDEVPDGTVDEVKEWVGDDPEKAQKALDAENESDTPRSTLVDHLEGLTNK